MAARPISRETPSYERVGIDPYDPELQTLAELAGIAMPPAILRSILQLLETGIAPLAIVRLLHEILLPPKTSEDYNRMGSSVYAYRHIEFSDPSATVQRRTLVHAEQVAESQILEHVEQEGIGMSKERVY